MVAANRGVEVPGAPASAYGAVIAESAAGLSPGRPTTTGCR